MRPAILLLVVLLFATGLPAQTPGFRFGPRVAAGASCFTGLPGMTNGTALQVGILTSKQLTDYFSVQFSPLVGMYGANRMSGETDGILPSGRARVYTYWDKYYVCSVEFPLLARFSFGFRNVYFGVFAGPSLGFNMGGVRSKRYDDPAYNAKNGYGGHTMHDIRRGMYSGVAGTGVEIETGKGVMSIDLRIHHTFSPMGQIEGSYFSARAATIGMAWLFNTGP